MKATICIALMMLFALSSCRVRLHVPNTTTPTEPFVQLKDGEKFKGLSVERNSGLFVKDKIFIGDTSFKSKDVAFYSTGHNNYANVGRKTFATQVADGKINLYSYLYTTTTTSMNGHGGMSTSTHQHINYYVQKGLGSPVMGLSYRNLASIEEPKTPEYKMLEKYRKTRIVSRSLGYGSLACLVAGFALPSITNNDKLNNAAPGIAAIGFGAVIGWLCVIGPNQARLLKSVLIADKSYKKGRNKR